MANGFLTSTSLQGIRAVCIISRGVILGKIGHWQGNPTGIATTLMLAFSLTIA
jgi:hypothetical protein